ncbi:MAG: hypothetical protein ACTSVP_03900 [Candidatus Heimdallarchaeota archaeon]
MKSRIKILKEIMEIEKQFALEDIDSEVFESKMQILEQQYKNAKILTEDELKKAIIAKEIPLSASKIIGSISIEDLLPNYNVPRTFYRHLKIQREIKELERNIGTLKHNIQKIKILTAEKRINQNSAQIKMETLEFDLRLAENRFGAREKYLKRNPTKGDLIKFTLENYLKFSYGHGVSNKAELKKLADELTEEVNLRKHYRDTLAELFATIKANQLEVRSKTDTNGMPDFKQLLGLQKSINELLDYIKLLTNDIREYSNCLSKIDNTHLVIDESHELFCPEDFGIDILIEGETDETGKPTREVDPLIETLAFDGASDSLDNFYLLDTENGSGTGDKDLGMDVVPTIIIPEVPFPTFDIDINLEVVGMEDFQQPFDIDDSENKMNVLTEQIIFDSFEGLLSKLIDKDIPPPPPAPISQPTKTEVTLTESAQPTQPVPPPVTQESKKVIFSSLSADIKEKVAPSPDASISSEEIIETYSGDEEPIVGEINDLEEIPALEPEEIDEIETVVIPKPTDIEPEVIDEMPSIPDIPQIESAEALPSLPPPPPPESKGTIQPTEIKAMTAETQKIETQEPEIEEEDLVRPEKSTMVSQELVTAATQAWQQSGKALFQLRDDGSREFLGYLQEVIVFSNKRLGFSLVSEATAGQFVIDKIFNQIKPLWVTEDLLESAEKRKLFVVQEVVDSLQVQRDVALHISKLQEFANFRNINYPTEEEASSSDIIGIVPLEKIRIKRGAVICKLEDILSPLPYRTAPWHKTTYDFEESPLGTTCIMNHGAKIGKVISIVKHPLMGMLLLVDTQEPDATLIDYLVQRLEIAEESQKERLWLVKYLISKQLGIPEGEALKPKTIINYSLNRGFPILPHEILNSYRIFVTFGAVEEISRKKTILKNSSRIFNPSEVIPLDCLRVRSKGGRHLGTCLGVSLGNNPVMLVSEKLSREVVALFSTATVEKEVMSDISQSVMGSIGTDLKDSLCSHNILKSLIASRKIQSLGEYGKYLSLMTVTGIDISRIQVVEKGTIFVESQETTQSTNIFTSKV